MMPQRRMLGLMAAVVTCGVSLAMGGGGVNAQAAPEHFHPKGKAPSSYTKAILEQQGSTLPFADTMVLRGNRVAEYYIYLDIAPLYAPRG